MGNCPALSGWNLFSPFIAGWNFISAKRDHEIITFRIIFTFFCVDFILEHDFLTCKTRSSCKLCQNYKNAHKKCNANKNTMEIILITWKSNNLLSRLLLSWFTFTTISTFFCEWAGKYQIFSLIGYFIQRNICNIAGMIIIFTNIASTDILYSYNSLWTCWSYWSDIFNFKFEHCFCTWAGKAIK